jgi:hypothetical protein
MLAMFFKNKNKRDISIILLFLGLLIIYVIHFLFCSIRKEGFNIKGNTVQEKQKFIETSITGYDEDKNISFIRKARQKCHKMDCGPSKTDCFMRIDKSKDDARSSCEAFSKDVEACYAKIYSPQCVLNN